MNQDPNAFPSLLLRRKLRLQGAARNEFGSGLQFSPSLPVVALSPLSVVLGCLFVLGFR